MPPTDSFHLSFVIAPGLFCTIFLIGRAFNDNKHPDWRYVFLSCLCGLAVISGAILGVVFLAPLTQTAWFGVIGDARPWPTFMELGPLFLGLGYLIGIWGALAISIWLTDLGVSKE